MSRSSSLPGAVGAQTRCRPWSRTSRFGLKFITFFREQGVHGLSLGDQVRLGRQTIVAGPIGGRSRDRRSSPVRVCPGVDFSVTRRVVIIAGPPDDAVQDYSVGAVGGMG